MKTPFFILNEKLYFTGTVTHSRCGEDIKHSTYTMPIVHTSNACIRLKKHSEI